MLKIRGRQVRRRLSGVDRFGLPLARERSLAGGLGSLGRWCRRHHWWVLSLWVAALGAGLLSAGPVFDRLVAGTGSEAMESVAGIAVLDAVSDDGRTVVGLVSGVQARTASVRQGVLFTVGRLQAVPGVDTVQTPYDLPGGRLPRNDAESLPRGPLAQPAGTGLLIRVLLDRLDPVRTTTVSREVSDILADGQKLLVAAGQPAALVRVGGAAPLNQQINEAVREEIGRAERIALLISAVVLVIVFGGVVAAVLPVVAAGVSVAVAAVVLLGLTLLTDLDANAVTVTSLLGLGLSIDYALLLVNRYREELRTGSPPEVAVGRAWSTAGHTIVFSSLTVGSALTGMVFFGVPALTAVGLAGLAIAVIAMVAALTLVGALLGLTTRWIQPARHAVGSPTLADPADGAFARLAALVQRRPWWVAVGTSAVLLAMAAPLVSTTAHLDGLESLPRTIEGVKVIDDLTTQYGLPRPPAVTVLARTDPRTLERWLAPWSRDAAVARIRPAAAVTKTLSVVQIDVKGDPQGVQAQRLVRQIRILRPADRPSWVMGDVAVQRDLTALIVARLPLAAGVSVAAMMLLLLLMTGSVVLPIKAVLMNVLSLAATWGILTLVFQHGVGTSLLGTEAVAGFNPVILVVILAFAFGLSMDYEIFLLARIKEYVDAGVDAAVSIRLGLQSTGRIITSAALLMVVVFGCFATARIGVVQQLGFGLAVAIALDAVLIRCILVPATMTLLGRRNWWAPRVVQRITAGIVRTPTVTRYGEQHRSLPPVRPRPPAIPADPATVSRELSTTRTR